MKHFKDTIMKNSHSAVRNACLFLAMIVTLSSVLMSNNVIAINDNDKTENHDDSHKDDHGDEKVEVHKDDHEKEEEGHVEITIINAQKAGIINAKADNGQINKSLTVYGRSVISQNAISQVSARFPGLITKLTPNVGDIVKAGENIAQVESSNSFKHYNITAPISGVVTQRFANPGELANQQPLLTLENYDQLWVEFKIFPSQRPAIIEGQQVIVSSSLGKIQSSITHLMATKNQPFITARVPLDNKNGRWTPGQLLTGSIVTHQIDVDLVIDNRAFQEVEGKRVIFVTNKGGYETREVQIGQSDGQFSQVLSGLNVGENYAVINSYLLKADLGKAGASHAH